MNTSLGLLPLPSQEPVGGESLYRGFLKRWFDTVVALGLAIVFLPVVLCVGMLVRLFLGSPVVFRQLRAARGGRPFVIYKFRTMLDSRGRDGQQLPDDARVTRFGRFLRATSLDELPELLNVLKGDMSLVGPRPLHVHYISRYSETQRRRLEVRPGITGLAQVNGRNALTWEDRFSLDVWYVDHITFLLDCRILLKTAKAAFVSEPGLEMAPEFLGTNVSSHRNERG